MTEWPDGLGAAPQMRPMSVTGCNVLVGRLEMHMHGEMRRRHRARQPPHRPMGRGSKGSLRRLLHTVAG